MHLAGEMANDLYLINKVLAVQLVDYATCSNGMVNFCIVQCMSIINALQVLCHSSLISMQSPASE